MAKRAASPEISLFPFLSILVCLIGALVPLLLLGLRKLEKSINYTSFVTNLI